MAWRHIAQDGLIKRSLSALAGQRLAECSGGSSRMDGIVNVLQYAVDGVAQQQQATANNLSNSETPGYTAQDVDFETSLQQALASPSGGTASTVISADPAAPATDGNNVDTSTQLVDAQTETLQYQTTVDMLNAQFRLISGAAGGSFS
jgi:flagellar basal-body rod protein FlgB